jgi:mono/diheme cytochrome c family protein
MLAPRIAASRRGLGKFLAVFLGCMGLFVSTALFCQSRASADDALWQRGRSVYEQSCADCHGDRGQGAEGAYERALVGDLSVGQLSRLIENTMPEGSPEDCVGADAQAVAAYMYQAFYSEAAQIRTRPPQLSLARLTAEQTRQYFADLYAHFDWIPRPGDQRGLTAEYFNSGRRSKENKVVERVDEAIFFDFGRESPGAGLPHDDFSIVWRGGLTTNVSGQYEIVIRSTCSFVCNLGHHQRTFIDNHVQSGDQTEFRKEIHLTAGRVYPFQLTFTQRKRTTELPPASVSVSWVPPGGAEQIIGPQNWVPGWLPGAFALQTPLPPDDRSYGYERGIRVDRDWDESTTSAILEFSQIAVQELWPAYQHKHRDQQFEGRSLLSKFLLELLTVAFRSPLQEDLAQVFVDKQIELEPDDGEAIKRVLLLGLKSPRFLYPAVELGLSPSARAGSRLALILWDSLPVDQRLAKAIDDNHLESEQQLREMAWHMLDDYRTRGKTRGMLNEWLGIGQFHDSAKQSELYPGFDHRLLSDLRESLDTFLDWVVWEGSGDYRQLVSADWGFTTAAMAEFYGGDWAPIDPFAASVPTKQEEPPAENQPSADEQPPAENQPPAEIQPPAENQPPAEIPPAAYDGLRKTPPSGRRAGVLNHPYMMSRLAYHDVTSPIHRGVFMLRYLLGRTMQPPQDAFSPLSPDLHPDLTTRQRVELQTSPESCQACHSRINGLGYVFEHWDAVGRFRQQERDQTIDAHGDYVNRDGNKIQFNGTGQLAEYVVSSTDAHQAFVRRAFQHFVQQPPAAYGEETLDRLTQLFVSSGFNIKHLLVEIAVTAATAKENSL